MRGFTEGTVYGICQHEKDLKGFTGTTFKWLECKSRGFITLLKCK